MKNISFSANFTLTPLGVTLINLRGREHKRPRNFLLGVWTGIDICVLSIYTIICLKSGAVRKLQVAILARSPREMSQTDRILPRYFLSRVRVSVRPRIFLYAKKLQKHSLRPITDRQRHHRQNGATRKAVHTQDRPLNCKHEQPLTWVVRW